MTCINACKGETFELTHPSLEGGYVIQLGEGKATEVDGNDSATPWYSLKDLFSKSHAKLVT